MKLWVDMNTGKDVSFLIEFLKDSKKNIDEVPHSKISLYFKDVILNIQMILDVDFDVEGETFTLRNYHDKDFKKYFHPPEDQTDLSFIEFNKFIEGFGKIKNFIKEYNYFEHNWEEFDENISE